MKNLTREHLILMELLLRSVSHSFGVLALLAASKAVATTTWWRGEVVGVVWVGSTLPMLFYVLSHLALLQRRIPRAEQIPTQKIINALFALGGMVMYAGSFLSWGVDYNVASIPISIALLGDLLIAGESLLLWQVFRTNAYTFSIVTVESEQSVISTGPYTLVRHPCIAQVSYS